MGSTDQRPAQLNGTPSQRATWWADLPSSQQERLVSEHPEWIGNSDGISAADRDRANRLMIPRVRADLQRRSDEMGTRLANNRFGGAFTSDDSQKWYVDKKLDDIASIEHELSRGEPTHPRFLISFDMSNGERGHTAVSVGNPDCADHIAVSTPGLGTTIHPSLTGDLPFQGMGGESRLLRKETMRQLGLAGRSTETVAAIAWIGYDTPNFTGPGGRISTVRGAFQVATSGKARDTAPILSRFLQGIAAASDRRPHLVALGHSYGSLVTAEALRLTQGIVTDVVFSGSPGLGGARGYDLDYKPEDFNLVGGRAYILKNDDDPVTDLGTFGSDPTLSPDLIRLSTRAGTDKTGVERVGTVGHATYTRDVDGKSPMAQYNMAAVVGSLERNLIYGP